MAYNQKHLEGLLKIIDEIVATPGNEWFNKQLQEKYSSKEYNSEEINLLLSDINRTKYYIKSVEKKLDLEAFRFYKKIKSKELRKELMIDFKEMKISLVSNDILEYARRLCIQIERCINYVIIDIDGWNVIKTDARFQPKAFLSLPNDNGIDFNTSFIVRGQKKNVERIKFKDKIIFCSIYYELKYDDLWKGIEEIYFLRNKASHGTLIGNDLHRFDKLANKFHSTNSFYYNMLDSFLQRLQALYC